MRSRRRFLIETATALAAAAVAPRARAYGYDGELGHPVPAPAALDFETIDFQTTPLNEKPSSLIVGVPKGLPPGVKLPLVVMLPGGHSNWQPHEAGRWCWWSEYGLGDSDAALRRGALTEQDFQGLVRPAELARFDADLAVTPYRGMVVSTPWCLTRAEILDENGAMNAAWLRQVVHHLRARFPVLPARAATGLGGMSSGGLWAMHCGALCEDLFGHVVATEPYTRELVPQLRRVIGARTTDQTLRIVSAEHDRIRAATLELVAALRADDVPVEYVEYLGRHDQRFAAGPGGIDALFTFDRRLRGEQPDGRPLRSPSVAIRSSGPVEGARAAHGLFGMASAGPASPLRTALLGGGALAGAGLTTATVRAALREGREPRAHDPQGEARDEPPPSSRRIAPAE